MPIAIVVRELCGTDADLLRVVVRRGRARVREMSGGRSVVCVLPVGVSRATRPARKRGGGPSGVSSCANRVREGGGSAGGPGGRGAHSMVHEGERRPDAR